MSHSLGTGELAGAAILLAAALVLVAISYRRTLPPTGRGFRTLLFGIRALAFILLMLALLDPVLTLARMRQEERVVAFIVDTSLSMTLPDDPSKAEPSARSRWNVARDLLWDSARGEGPALVEAIRKRMAVRLFAGDAGTREIPDDAEAKALEPGGGSSELARVIREAGRAAGPELAAMVLVSDGRNTAAEDAAAAARDALVPVHTVLVGESGSPPDLVVIAARGPETAYAGAKFNVEFDVAAHGYDGRPVPVVLREDGKTLDSLSVTVPPEGTTRGRVSVTPTVPGAHRYTVSVPSAPGEVVAANNEAHLLVTVEKEKIRVLYLEPVPRWDYAFLGRTLARDEGVAVETRLTGRNATTAFPGERELADVDVLILGNFPLHAFDAATVQRIASFVAAGRGLLLLGGDEAFRPLHGGMPGFLPYRSAGGGFEGGAHRVVLTARGGEHAVTRLALDEATNRVLWESLPPLLARNTGLVPAPGAEVLLETRTPGAASTPLLLVSRAGEGKTAAIAGAGVWRWSFLMSGTGRGSDAYDRLASNLVRWLAARDDAGVVRATPDRSLYRFGEPVGFTARVFDESLMPRPGMTVRATLVAEGRQSPDTAAIVLEEVRGNPGVYRGRFGPLPPARYAYRVEASAGGRYIGESKGETEVVASSVEFEALDTDPELLRRIASETGGGFYRASDTRGLVEALSIAPARRREEAEVRPGRSPWLFIAVIALLGTEWTLRRRRGLW